MHKLRVQPGPGALERFRRQVHELLGLPPDGAFEVTFEVKAPTSGACSSAPANSVADPLESPSQQLLLSECWQRCRCHRAGDRLLLEGISAFDAAAHCAAVSAARRLRAAADGGAAAGGGSSGDGGGRQEQRSAAAAARPERQRQREAATAAGGQASAGDAAAPERPRALPHDSAGRPQMEAAGRAGGWRARFGWLSRVASLLSDV